MQVSSSENSTETRWRESDVAGTKETIQNDRELPSQVSNICFTMKKARNSFQFHEHAVNFGFNRCFTILYYVAWVSSAEGILANELEIYILETLDKIAARTVSVLGFFQHLSKRNSALVVASIVTRQFYTHSSGHAGSIEPNLSRRMRM